MGFSFIDSQPIRFNSSKFDDQACINKDLSAYALLNQRNDPIHFQAKLTCCDDNKACDATEEGAELVTDGNMSNAGAFTLGTGWAIAAGVATYTAGVDAALSQSGLAITTGRPYVVRVKINSNSTGYGVDVFLGGRRIETIDSLETGIITIYGTAGVASTIYIKINNDYSIPTTGTLVIDDLSVKPLANCYTFDTSSIERVNNGTFDGGSTVVNANWTLGAGWAWNAGNFVRHGTPAATALLSQNIPLTNNREDHTFSVTTSNRTTGNVTFQYGNEAMSVISSNGVTSFVYPAKTLENTLISFLPGSNFDGDIDSVSMIETRSAWTYEPGNGFCHSPGWSNAFYAGNTLTVGFYHRMKVRVIVDAGSVEFQAGGVSLGTVNKTGTYKFFFTALTTAGEKFIPSADFDGCILDDIEICPLGQDVQIRLIYQDGTGATDWHTTTSSANPLIIDDDFVTWRIGKLSEILVGGNVSELPYSCYRMQIQKTCIVDGDEVLIDYTSDTVINYKLSHGCTKLFQAYCDGDALDFRFGSSGTIFRLYQRFEMLYFNPSHPIEADDYEFSNGSKRRIFAKRSKKYKAVFNYCDEYAHDTISNMIVCDTLMMDGLEIIVEAKDYEANWSDRGKRNLAQSEIEYEIVGGILFNRNCS